MPHFPTYVFSSPLSLSAFLSSSLVERAGDTTPELEVRGTLPEGGEESTAGTGRGKEHERERESEREREKERERERTKERAGTFFPFKGKMNYKT